MNPGNAYPIHSPEELLSEERLNSLAGKLDEQSRLLGLARHAIQAAIQGQSATSFKPENISPSLERRTATFVTLTLRGQLRGCIGNLEPRHSLYQSVMVNAVAAALRDSRFSPVTAAEVDELEIHISILSALTPARYDDPDQLLNQLRPGVDGVVLRLDGKTSTFLPQVWEKLPDKARFMDSLCAKGGLPSDAWKKPDAEILVYQVFAFGEEGA